MPKNVMKMLKPKATLGRNDFDLSHRTVFPASFGELIPGMCVETTPGDKIKVRISDLVRAVPMVTSPFLRAKQHVDVWFVPYNMMWSRFNEFITDKDEPSSSSLNDRLYVPHVGMQSIIQAISSWANTGLNFKDIHGVHNARAVARNLDLLGLPGSYILKAIGNTSDQTYINQFTQKVNLWRIAAYNLIWYREYRQQYYDDGKYLLPTSIAALSKGASYLFNFDDLPCDTEAHADISHINQYLLEALVQPRFRTWKKDIFTGLMPSTQFGNVSVVSIVDDTISFVNPTNINTSFESASISKSSGKFVSLKGSGSGSLLRVDNGSVDILSLRKSEAIQRWRENALRAGNQIEDNFEAHYGRKPKSHMQCHPQHLGSFSSPLNVGDVNATAQTGASTNGILGDVAGKGIMSFDGSEEISFESSDFGVMMAIYSILPEAEYNANNIDRMNALLEKEDYFIPEYENLGLEAVGGSVISVNGAPSVLGYAPRYFGYKQKHDRCVGQFMNFTMQGSNTAFGGMYRQWCSPKYDVDRTYGSIPLSLLYVNPAIYDVNITAAYSLSDQFLVDFYCDVDAIRHMTVSGMPGY